MTNLDDGVVRIWLIVKNDVPRDATILDGRDHQRHGLAVVDVDQRRGRRDRGCAIVVRRNSAQRPVVVDGGKNKPDLVLDVFVVGQRRPRPRLLRCTNWTVASLRVSHQWLIRYIGFDV